MLSRSSKLARWKTMKISITRPAAALTVLCAWTVVSGDTTGKQPWETDFLLPLDTRPTHYELYLFPNLDTGNFSGSVTIDINVSQQKTNLWLHAVDLMISETILMPIQGTQGASITIDNTFFYTDYSFFVIVLKNPIPTGQYKLKLKFTGILRKDKVGLYIYSYVDSKETTRKLVGSYLEPYGARSVFPAFDQPDMKATFTVQMVRPSRLYRALSNMNQASEMANSPSSGLTTVLFNTSPPMSTLFLSFFVVDYDALPTKYTDNGIAMTMYGDGAKIKDLVYAFNVAVAAMNFYITYFNVSYGLPKLDLVTLPDRQYTAYEGWGLIYLNENVITYQPGVTSAFDQFIIVAAVQHEVVNMWCGDLVTESWWTEVFIYEGLAYYLQFAGFDNLYPSWEIYNFLPFRKYSPAMDIDISVTAAPMVRHGRSINDGTEPIQIIVQKSPAVLNMLSDVIGSVRFRSGVSSFLKTYALKTATVKDLWNQIQLFSDGVNINKFMASFTEKNGFPLVNVTLVGNKLRLTQSRFTQASNTLNHCIESEIVGCGWEIPVTMVGSNNYVSTTPYWFHMDQPTLEITVPQSLTWCKLNKGQVGYYVTLYEKDYWTRLADVLKNNYQEMRAADRANLVYDVFYLAKQGHVQLETAFNIVKYMDKEDYYTPWAFFYWSFLDYDNMFALTSIYPFFRKFLLDKVAPHIDGSVFVFDPDSTFFLRRKNRVLVRFACAIGEKFCLKRSKQLFINWLINCGPKIYEDIRDVVSFTGMSQCGVYEWDLLWSRYLKEEDSDEKDFLFETLCNTHESWLINRLIDMAEDEKLVSGSRYGLLLTNFASNSVALPIIWDFFRSNVISVVEKVKRSDTELSTVLENMIATFNTELRLNELDVLLKMIPTQDLGMEARTSLLNSVTSRINFLKQNEDSLRKWFQDATQ